MPMSSKNPINSSIREVCLAADNPAHSIFNVIDLLTKIPAFGNELPGLISFRVEFKDGSKADGSGRDFARRYEDAKKRAAAAPVNSASFRFYRGKKDETGFLSVKLSSAPAQLAVSFMESGSLSEEYVARCLRELKGMGFRLSPHEMDNKTVDILCLCLDIRGFSHFCSSPDVESNYVAKALGQFFHLIRESFYDTMYSMLKPVGDGALMVWTADHVSLSETSDLVAVRTVELARSLKQVFSQDSFYIPVPSDLGAGLAKGIAIEMPGDYIGRPLNLATRLCENARPSGLLADFLVGQSIKSISNIRREIMDNLKGFEAREIWSMPFEEPKENPSAPEAPPA